jgi:2',3'-cyclic-nucleotide 2'-phosphodiesterase (5'-nucleotidase family)
MLKILESGEKGIYHTYGLQQKIAISKATGNKSLVYAKFSNGEEIVPTKTYRGVSTDFLLAGGDDFKDVMNIVYSLRKNVTEGEMRGMIRE